ncbi:Sperm associated antigen 1 [Boothiomyces sp. JEL0866]|nr:Sperm associated antigen 1 [Boothiomyces sp. JEL0866]
MLGPQDMQGIAKLVDPGFESARESEVDINHLDYAYVEKCTDVKYLKVLLAHLKSEKDGYFPHLEEFMIKRIETLDPSIKLSPLNPHEKYQMEKEVENELSDWINSVSTKDSELARVVEKNEEFTEDIVPESTFVSTNSYEKPVPIVNKNTNRIKSNDYRAWDKFDVDKEVEKIDQTTEKSAPTKFGTTSLPQIEIPRNITKQDSEYLAVREKEKGNECLASKEFDQALIHYTTSIKLNPTCAGYNNRALCYMKLKKYSNAAEDCSKSLQLEFSFKACLRRSMAYYNTGRYQDAVMDIEKCLETKPNDKEALDLKTKIYDKWSSVDGTIYENPKKSTRLKIVEIEQETTIETTTKDEIIEEEITEIKTEGAIIAEKKKFVFEDVEDDSDDEPVQKQKIKVKEVDSDDED